MKNLRTGTAKFDTIRAKDANGLHLQDDGGNGLFIKDGGNVGIGTTSPDYTLDVRGFISAQASALSSDAVINLAGSNASAYSAVSRIKSTSESDSNAASSLTFSTRAADNSINERMRITSAGNVGIGTTNPVTKLDLNEVAGTKDVVQSFSKGGVGQARVGLCGATSQVLFGALADDLCIRSDGHNIRFGTASATRTDMTIDSAGNVGIGTTSPNQRLEVLKSGGGRIRLSETSARYVEITGYAEGNANGSTMAFSTNQSGTSTLTERMRINSQGNVGIGTTNPSQKLDVRGSINLRSGYNLTWDGNGLIASDALKMIFYVAGGEIMRINSAGNVGIGTTNPFARLGIELPTNTTLTTGLFVRNPSSHTGSGGSNIASFHGPTDYVMQIKSNGNVGIGTTNPGTNKLYVGGNIYASGTITPSSDDRVKHNEQPIVGALETLSKITPKKYIKTTEMYDANHDFELDADGNPIDSNGEPVEHRIEAGVIAQQVLTVDELAFAVSPEGVDEDGTVTSPHGLDYNSLFTYAIAAIQEQQQLIDDLKSQNESLAARISALES